MSGNFFDELVNHFLSVEKFVPRVYTDIYGVPTVGIGYAIVTEDGKHTDGTKKYKIVPGWQTNVNGG